MRAGQREQHDTLGVSRGVESDRSEPYRPESHSSSLLQARGYMTTTTITRLKPKGTDSGCVALWVMWTQGFDKEEKYLGKQTQYHWCCIDVGPFLNCSFCI